ncbi:hypothetical protein HMJ29_03605 [Hymenobacter taeanensis]|uniref:Uncharacterized protein n=1 Tax=Hymenobacter taeanensis TaxID=2735321 RepID=A0A6M6BDM8_9BACT|nr:MULTISPECIES: hypothetical protein [Hymenobacter]QJX46072.1 hypothetical protein HMJ29_03605 [Hymenobacter taeanensis]UOQ79926.1 hypothetical protein MUN83_13860 [Hymenobacter sp. 5414T-23]
MNTYFPSQNGERVNDLLSSSPFADESEEEFADVRYEEMLPLQESFGVDMESPFISELEITGEARPTTNPLAEQMVSMLAELHDHEFNEALFELANEFEDVAATRFANEAGEYSLRTVSELRNHAAPLIYELETMINNMATEMEREDMGSKSEAELEQFFDRYLVDHEGFSPRFEQFFGKVFRVVKNVARKAIDIGKQGIAGAVDLAKKGVAFAGKFLPIGVIMKKLRALVKPLVHKVINFAINRLPIFLRPIAKQFVNKLMNRESFETEGSYAAEAYETEAETEQPTTYEINEIQMEFNARVTNLLFAETEQESEATVNNYLQENEQPQSEDEASSLDAARERFVQELSELKDGEDPTPAIQRFIPALLPILKVAITVIGRDKVVNFLGGLVAQLVGKILGNTLKTHHRALGNAIADIGMSMISLESPLQNQERLGYEAYASTVEEILTEIGSRPENYTAEPEVVQSLVSEAFETAVANNFPAAMIKPALRQASGNGMWYKMPRVKRFYRKYSTVFPVVIDARTALQVKSFKGQSLASFFKDKLGLPMGKPVQAKVHLYEAIRHTKLSVISRMEKLPGLGSSNWSAYCQLHPLTTSAAAMLLKEPGLGRDVDARFLQSRDLISTGQRFYFLEIPGAKVHPPYGAGKVNRPPVPVTPGAPWTPPKVEPVIPRSSDAQCVLNFLKSEVRFNFFFSGEDARAIGQKLGSGDYLSAVGTIRNVVRDILTNTLVRNVPHKVKFVHEAMPELYLENFEPAQEQFLGGVARAAGGALVKFGKDALVKVVEKLINKFADVVYNSIITYLKSRKQEFITASANQSGVTVKAIFTNVPIMSKLRLVISAMKGTTNLGDLADFVLPSLPTPSVVIVGGRQFD